VAPVCWLAIESTDRLAQIKNNLNEMSIDASAPEERGALLAEKKQLDAQMDV
jgi:hypothetical protein